jgi:glycosyltransferase involved in cell wall biosynthesis
VKILHFVTSLNPNAGGTVRAFVDLVNGLAALGHTVSVVAADSSATPPGWLENTHSLKLLSVGKPRFFGLAIPRGAQDILIREMQSVDVLHVHGVWSYTNILVCRLAARLRKPFVISLHGMLDDWPMGQSRLRKRMFLTLLGNKWLSAAARIHVTAQLELEQSGKWFPERLGVVIPNLLDMTPFRCFPDVRIIEPYFHRLAPNRARVLFLSRLHPKKGLEILLRASALLKFRGKPVSIIVAGEGTAEYCRALNSLTRELGLGDDEVVFLGSVTGDPKLALYRSCDVFALPTHHENFGYVLVEALACGLCLVTTRAVAIAMELHSTGAALLADATPEGFAEAIDALLADRESLRTKGEVGRQRMFLWFDGQKIIRQYEQMYFHCVGQTLENSLDASRPKSLEAERNRQSTYQCPPTGPL